MNTKFIDRYDLDYFKTLSYFTDHIQCGKKLPEIVIKNIDFRNGKFFTFLPSTAILSKLYEFSCGGIIPSIPCDHQDRPLKDQDAVNYPRKVITMDSKLSGFINIFLQKSAINYAIFDDYLLEATNPNVDIENSKSCCNGQEVYHCLSQNNSAIEVYNIIRQSSLSWHFLCVLLVVHGGIPSIFTPEQMLHVVNNVRYIIAGAYDGEAHIIWKKSILENGTTAQS